MKSLKQIKDRGFTIVELLVVIVVIGILASITIVSYTGVSGRANTKSNLANARNVLAAVLAAQTETGAFPVTGATSATVIGNINVGVGKIPSTLTVDNTQLVTGNNTKIQYLTKGSTPFTGACVGYWSYEGTPGAIYLTAGDATTGTNLAGSTSTCA